MIFPVADLVPDICGGLSVRDVRAIACVSRDVHGMIAPFMRVRVDETVEYLHVCRVTHYRTMWPRLHREIKHEIEIHNERFHIDVQRPAADYTGMLIILRGNPLYEQCDKYYVYVRNGFTRYGVGSRYYGFITKYNDPDVYEAYTHMHFAHFIDIFMLRAVYGMDGGGYISSNRLNKLRADARACGYKEVKDFIGSADFMRMLAQW